MEIKTFSYQDKISEDQLRALIESINAKDFVLLLEMDHFNGGKDRFELEFKDLKVEYDEVFDNYTMTIVGEKIL